MTVGDESTARILGRFVCELSYDDLPEQIGTVAKTRILDSVSCALAGRDLPHSKVALQLVANSRGDSTVFGHRRGVGTLDAAMANGVLSHSILQEDEYRPLHPSTYVVPAAMAVAEQEHVSGKELIVSLVLGYELGSRFVKACRPFANKLLRNGPSMGAIGCAAAACRLLKLDREQATNGVGYGASLAPGALFESWWTGSMEAMFQAGTTAMLGIMSANIAKAGATTASEVFEGRHGFMRAWAGSNDNLGLITKDLGKSYEMAHLLIKLYPACGTTQVPIQIGLRLADRLNGKSVTSVVERVPQTALRNAGQDTTGPFNTQFQAQMSNQFAVAAALLGRPVESVSFWTEHYQDPKVHELARKIQIVREEGRAKMAMEVRTADGALLVEEEGSEHEAQAPTQEQAVRKFSYLAGPVLGDEKTRQVSDMVMNLERVEDIHSVTRELA